jgi:hypothetical protein
VNDRRLWASASMTTAVAFALMLAGCSSPVTAPQAHHSPKPAPTASSAAPESAFVGTSGDVAASCAVLSIIVTNVSNAQSLFADGTISQGAYSTVLNTVYSDLQVIDGAPGFALQPEIAGLVEVTRPASGTLGGASFDAQSPDFLALRGKVSQACATNGSPIGIMDATSARPDKP